MKKIFILLALISFYVINAHEIKTQINKNKQTTIYFDKKEKFKTLILNLQTNENTNIEINTESEIHSYKIPKIINQEKELTIEIKMNNILSIIINNIENKNLSIETEESNIKKFKILISQNEYSIAFNLDRNIFPLIGFKAKKKY
ncbi:hypothetical protein [Borrelia sp. A-FGy1]|uniref:hypothetical protein n=1 Tax=Borrelia sp. A-FGy1 TaxID=2608247 RepID=UPI001E6480CA|nr:hypothetical protein [Borrelia sp. A-FGy1]